MKKHRCHCELSEAISKLRNILIILLFFFAGAIFSVPQKVHADVSDNINSWDGVVVNEVMANFGDSLLGNSDNGREWLEIANFSSQAVNLSGWQLKSYNDNILTGSSNLKKTFVFSSIELDPNNYLVVTTNKNYYNPCSNCDIYDLNSSTNTSWVTNTKGKIALIGPAPMNYEYDFTWNRDIGDGYSMETVGPPSDSDYNDWQKSSVGGTPGNQNSVSLSLTAPTLSFPTNNQNLINPSNINFSWAKVSGVNYEFILSDNNKISEDNILSDSLIDKTGLADGNFNFLDSLDPGTYYWQVITSNTDGDTVPSSIFSFTISAPVYSSAISITELLPNPSGDEALGEFIELYNSSSDPVDLTGWQLQDVDGATTNYIFPSGTTITGGGYLNVYRNTSGITLNNDTDAVALFQPSGHQLFATPLFESAPENLAWAIGSDGIWNWTTTPTVGKTNIITLPILEEDKVQEIIQEPDPVINTITIEIQTGDFENYLDKLVKISGKVVSTSGSTFYLDDGSGIVKVYIQTKTGIKKPTMHKNDVFEVVGIIDLYGQTWRILPQNQNDIRLIEEAAKVVTKKVAVKKVATETVAIVKEPLITKAVAAAATSSLPQNVDSVSTSTPFWQQLVKMIVGLAVILFVIFIIKIINRRKEKLNGILGGHFGDDET